jgi:hypothetical protein
MSQRLNAVRGDEPLACLTAILSADGARDCVLDAIYQVYRLP